MKQKVIEREKMREKEEDGDEEKEECGGRKIGKKERKRARNENRQIQKLRGERREEEVKVVNDRINENKGGAHEYAFIICSHERSMSLTKKTKNERKIERKRFRNKSWHTNSTDASSRSIDHGTTCSVVRWSKKPLTIQAATIKADKRDGLTEIWSKVPEASMRVHVWGFS